MTFKLRIRGRDYLEPSPAANPANPLILAEQDAGLPTVAANDETGKDLTQHTISRLAGLAGPAIEKAQPYSCLSDADRIRARAYHQHHFGCKTCIAAGRGTHYDRRCAVGLALWNGYNGTDDLQTEGGNHGQT